MQPSGRQQHGVGEVARIYRAADVHVDSALARIDPVGRVRFQCIRDRRIGFDALLSSSLAPEKNTCRSEELPSERIA